MNKRPVILCLSKDPDLLEIRRRVLSLRYDATGVGSLAEMKALPAGSSFSLLVLCYTVPEWECGDAVALAQKQWPGIEVLALSTALFHCAQKVSLVVDSLAGPPALFQGITYLLDRKEHVTDRDFGRASR